MSSRLIIYPTDFSECAKNAKAYAIAMGKALKCKIRILHAVEIGSLASAEKNPDALLTSIKTLEEQAKKKLVKLKEEIESFGLECEYQILEGRTLFLKDYMESLDPLMIVMGTTGKSGIENKIFGSFAAQTIHNQKSIILAIPLKAKFNTLSKIVFATDFHKKDKTCLSFINKITNYYGSDLQVVHISDNVAELQQEREKFSQLEEEITKVMRSHNIRFEFLYGDKVEDELLEFLDSSKPDMLALVGRKRNFIERIFDKSLSKKMVNQTHVPVLVFS
ncbi:MAG: universal stress protein [Maribacter sp.]|nr:universal stress protein [Maribacter sp.]